MDPFQCAKCEHWCEHGILYSKRVPEGKRYWFKCSECRHSTTVVYAPQEGA